MSGLPLHTPLRPQESLGSQGVDSSPNFRRHPDDAHALCAHMYMHTRTHTHRAKELPLCCWEGGFSLQAPRQLQTASSFWKTPRFPHRRRIPSAPVSCGCSPGPLSGSPSGHHHAGGQLLCSTLEPHTAPWSLAGTAGGPALASEHENTTDPCVSRYWKGGHFPRSQSSAQLHTSELLCPSNPPSFQSPFDPGKNSPQIHVVNGQNSSEVKTQ